MLTTWKPLIIAFLVGLCVTSSLGGDHHPRQKHAICNKGQSFWCRNITTAAECKAVKHCIRGVWEKEIPIEVDKSSVCQTCIDMVNLARDQLRSNETQEELKEVLEGTCKVIPEKHLRKDCDKLMDDFGSYIVDTLSSEMNPQVVCSVAGLCNSPKFAHVMVKKLVKLDCDNCHGLMRQIEGDIEEASTNDLFSVLSGICGKLGTYSDICASLLHEHMERVDALVRNNIRAKPVCSLAGVCSKKFHDHREKVSVTHEAVAVEVFKKGVKDDDLPCELCQQLVKHLRDVLIANTTEEEFKEVLEGLCNMTIYKNDCPGIIGQYYDVVYQFLMNELDGKVLCKTINICPNNGHFVRPLILTEDEPPKQLPVERLNPLTFIPAHHLGATRKSNPELCSFCEYFLHFVQQEITLPSSETELTDVVLKGCDKLPATIKEQCDSFVQTYMPTFIALLAQRIDPSQVCPSLGVCPSTLVAVEYKDKPTCPLCLLAMESTLKKITNKTEDDINEALDDLCLRDVFPNTIMTECVKFITDFRKPVTDMILAEFTSQEACVYISLCQIPHTFTSSLPEEISHYGDIETNEIRKVNGPNTCVICEFVMTKLEKALKNKETEEEIKDTVMRICNYLPRTVGPQCKSFIEQYSNLILDLLAQEISPKEMCTALNLCGQAKLLLAAPVKKCIACELLMDGLRTILTDHDIDEDINKSLLRACASFPHQQVNFCKTMVAELAPQIEAALQTLPVGPLVCRRIHMCEADRGHRVKLLGRNGSQCYAGPSYWCSSTITAAKCEQIEYCQKHVWMGDKPRKSHLKGTHVI